MREFFRFFWDKINFDLTQRIVNRVYLLFCKYYREVVMLLEFSIQKFKEAEFSTNRQFNAKVHNGFSVRCMRGGQIDNLLARNYAILFGPNP